DDFQRYFVWRWSNSDDEAMSLRLTSDGDLTTRGDLLERNLKRRLERLPGVARVEVEGVARQEVEVAISPERLEAHGVALDELVRRLQDANFSVSAGMITDGGERLRVQPRGERASLQQLRDLPVGPGGTRLSDIADITLKPQRMGYVRQVDGKPSRSEERRVGQVGSGRSARDA